MSDELSNWLKYYQDLGFTHLYRKNKSSSFSQIAQSQRSTPNEPRAGAEKSPTDRLETRLESNSPSVVLHPRGNLVSSNQRPDLFTVVEPRETLEEIQRDLGEDCRRCKLWKGRKTIVFGSGNPNAELVFVGEGPGAYEDEQGLPFVGRAGQLLTEMIEKGLKIPRPAVYICNIVKCRPPNNRKPERDEVAACRGFVERQLNAIQPRAVCALGATAAETLLGTRESMGSLRGRWFEFKGFPLIVTFHPAYLLRDPSKKRDAWTDLKAIIAFLNSGERK